MYSKRKVCIIGVPMDLGQTRRGVDMGPSAIRYAGLREKLEELNFDVKDHGNIYVSHYHELEESLKNLTAVTEVSKALAIMVDDVIQNGFFPLVLGGDHSIAIGTIAGVTKHYQNTGVIWYDAHGDLNTPKTSPSGNIHGMPLAVSMGLGHEQLTTIYERIPKIKAENIVIIGARSLDKGEKELIKEKNIKVYTMHEVDRLGMAAVITETIDYLKERVDGIHLSLDLDSLDPIDAPGVGTPVVGGLTYRESHLAMEMLAESGLIVSAEFVEVNPILDEKNKTAEAAVALIGSLFGEKLL
ncbi:arginase [Domibacillus aminovorans]|uniref:Arginase n=1 Tax=Domibacillus aminovorans TaxID=29332 RepID=A0A177L3N9_9BACI|nr:arginase [Domibacillus aminovorans]OAH60163.1 arginase [Domibacillus aminovorans]